MNEVIKELMERKSVRVYTDQPIGEAQKEAILLAAANAPSAGNMQLYSIIDVQDKQVVERLAVLCDNQPFIAQGQMVLVFVSDYLKWHDAFALAGADPRPLAKSDLLLSIEDAMAAAMNAVTAADSLGIGSCFIGDIMEHHDEVKELLTLPDCVYPVCLLVFGYPTDQQKERTKPERIDLKHLVHNDHYQRKDGETLKEMLIKKCPADQYENWLRAFCKRKYNSDFSIEMSASAAKYLEEFK